MSPLRFLGEAQSRYTIRSVRHQEFLAQALKSFEGKCKETVRSKQTEEDKIKEYWNTKNQLEDTRKINRSQKSLAHFDALKKQINDDIRKKRVESVDKGKSYLTHFGPEESAEDIKRARCNIKAKQQLFKFNLDQHLQVFRCYFQE